MTDQELIDALAWLHELNRTDPLVPVSIAYRDGHTVTVPHTARFAANLMVASSRCELPDIIEVTVSTL